MALNMFRKRTKRNHACRNLDYMDVSLIDLAIGADRSFYRKQYSDTSTEGARG